MTQPNDARSQQRARDAETILRAAIDAADPAPAVGAALSSADLHAAQSVSIVAIGKAAGTMTHAALGAVRRHSNPHAPASAAAPHIRSALVVAPHGTLVPAADDVQVVHAAHPVPDATSSNAAAHVEALLSGATDGEIVILLISGGASALCAAPAGHISMTEYAAVVDGLLRAGADIVELNTVRSHMDRLKGGGMARLVHPARALGLIVSDVTGNPLDIIASGPLTPPSTTDADAVRVLEKYGLWAGASPDLREALALTRQPDPPTFEHVTVRVIMDNGIASAGAAAAARDLGYDVRLSDRPVTGAARDAGSRIAREALAVNLGPRDRPLCIISGGETTVTVSGTGKGGRNQELVLAGALELRDALHITIASIGTDGIDGPTDAAGAVCDAYTIARATRAGIDAALALSDNDSYTFFDTAGGLIRTGPTGTNVMDVQIALIDPA